MGIEKWREGNTAAGWYERIDVTNFKLLEDFIKEQKITTVYHLASLLLELQRNNAFVLKLNLEPLLHFVNWQERWLPEKDILPSSISCFWKGIPKNKVGQEVVLNPTTVYGISKMAGEKWCEYYFDKYGVDVEVLDILVLFLENACWWRNHRLCSEIFYEAVQNGKYKVLCRKYRNANAAYGRCHLQPLN